MGSSVAGVPYVQVVLPLPAAGLLVGAIETTLMENSKLTVNDALERPVVEMLSQLRDFFEDVSVNPSAFPVTGKMATSLKNRNRKHKNMMKGR